VPGRLTLGVVVLSLLSVAELSAQPLQPTVEVHGCEGLDPAELTRLLHMELASAAIPETQIHAPVIEVQCGRDLWRLTLHERRGGGYLDRLIPAPAPDEPARERIVALAASQMLLAWLPEKDAELAEARAAEPPPQPETPPPAPAAPPPPPPRPRARHTWLFVSGGLRGADLGAEPFMLSAASLGVRGLLARPVTLGGRLEVLGGSTTREAGRVEVRGGVAGMDLRWQFLRRGAFSLPVTFGVGVAYLSLDGDGRGAVEGRTLDGVAIDARLDAGPRFSSDGVGVALLLRLGVMALGPEGRVVGEAPVSPDGPWAGAGIELSLSP
jgi:hypothetical protein